MRHYINRIIFWVLILSVCWVMQPREVLADDPLIGEVRWVAFNFAPKNWALCNGQLLPILQNQALFALLGTTYGGNGQTNFALPNLQGRAPIHAGNGYTLGQQWGEENHTLIASEMPTHTHALAADPKEGNLASPVGAYPAKSASGTPAFGGQSSTTLAPDAVSSIGSNQSHNNMKPYLAMTCIIALQGVFPSQN